MQYHHYAQHFDFIIIIGVFLSASIAEIVIVIVNIHIFGKKCTLGFNFFKKAAVEDKKCNAEAPWNFKSRRQIDSYIK